jgi:hypothetical protein
LHEAVDTGHIEVVKLPNVLDNKEVFLHACATVAFALRAVADAVRTRTEKLPYYRVHSVLVESWPEGVREREMNLNTRLARGHEGDEYARVDAELQVF